MVELENNQRFSESLSWQYMRDYFEKKGIDAWALGEVPYYITNNALIAYNYANITLRFIQDCINNKQLRVDSPFYVIELGAGSGKFGYLFLQQITALLCHFHLEHLQFCYVMTDFTPSNLTYWQKHPGLQKFIQEGVLDFAIFDATKSQDLTLTYKNEMLNTSAIHNPTVIIANYFFDSLNCDIMRVKNRELEEGLVSLKTEKDNVTLEGISSLSKLQADFSFRKAKLPYYSNKIINKILLEYIAELSNGTFCVPTCGINVINNLARLSNDQFLLITADKGYVTLESICNLDVPYIAFHGSFSMMVNYDFLGRYIKKLGGDVLFADEHTGMKTSLFSGSKKFNDLPETSLTNYQFNTLLSTREFLEIKNFLIKDITKLNLSNILSLMKFSHWDPDIFIDIFPQLIKLINQASASYINILRDALKLINNNYYFIKNKKNFPRYIGHICYLINEWDTALNFYQQSLDYFGENASTFLNIGLCYYHKKSLPQALQYLQKAQHLENSDDPKITYLILLIEKEIQSS